MRFLKLPHWDREKPWLNDNNVIILAPVIFCRSPRYRNDLFAWKEIHAKHAHEAIFMGLPEEHYNFCKEIGEVPYHATKDFLEVAQVMAGAELVVTNQTSMFWVAEGLKKSLVLEYCTWCQNCHFLRKGFHYGSATYLHG